MCNRFQIYINIEFSDGVVSVVTEQLSVTLFDFMYM